jgi:RNA polymerase sigma-70 factor (ECF subfamily)
MSLSSVHTVHLHHLVDRMRAGDAAAQDELIRGVCGRLEKLARKMLRRFPDVGRWFQTDDVLQSALLRLLRSLQEVRPDSMRAFFGLAAEQLRRELLDLARRIRGPRGLGANQASHGPAEEVASPASEPADQAEGPDDLDKWCCFHEAVANLPAEEREVVGLVFYHGWAQAEIAELFQIDVRTVRRRWRAACLRLGEVLKGELPKP